MACERSIAVSPPQDRAGINVIGPAAELVKVSEGWGGGGVRSSFCTLMKTIAPFVDDGDGDCCLQGWKTRTYMFHLSLSA